MVVNKAFHLQQYFVYLVTSKIKSMFNKIKGFIRLMKNIDIDALNKLTEKVDLPKAMESLSKMDDMQLNGLMKMLEHGSGHKQKELPPINGDFYDISHSLNEEDRALQLKVRAFMEKEIQPIVNEYWFKA